jgi:hypothetical protein
MGDTVVVKPSNNIYTALAGLAVVAVATGLVLFFLKAKALLGEIPPFM